MEHSCIQNQRNESIINLPRYLIVLSTGNTNTVAVRITWCTDNQTFFFDAQQPPCGSSPSSAAEIDVHFRNQQEESRSRRRPRLNEPPPGGVPARHLYPEFPDVSSLLVLHGTLPWSAPLLFPYQLCVSAY
jgi:hypothetical protein